MTPLAIDNHLLNQVIDAIKTLQGQMRWKPGKGIEHLRTRQDYGHVPASATMADYEAIIASILHDSSADVYVYLWRSGTVYPTVVANRDTRLWLVMFDLDGIMETAFPPTDPERYLSDSRFQYLGTIEDLVL
jgi:hypothetical protein